MAQPPRDTPSVNPQPPKNDGDMNRVPLQDGPTQPQAQKGNLDISRSTEPSHDGTGTHENHDQKPILLPSRDGSDIDQPPKKNHEKNHDMNKSPHEGISQAVEKLSPTDREELMKLIRSFLESKGIQVTLPVQPTPGTNPSTEPVKPTPTNTVTEPTTPSITNPEHQNKNQTRRTSPKRKTPPSISSSTSISVSTK